MDNKKPLALAIIGYKRSGMSVSRLRQTVRESHVLQLLIEDYPKHPEQYVRTYMLQINGKHRKIVAYQPDDFGNSLREIHRMIANMVHGIYKSSPCSYAYKEKVNVLDALKEHLSSATFLKTDIHAYFDSVEFGKTMECIFLKRPTMKGQHKFWEKVLSVCFYEGHLPIGFISSPVLSDLYLNDLDERFSGMKGVRYTRYADDIIFSSNAKNAEDKLGVVLEDLKDYLAPMHLELNKKKTYIRTLKLEGDAIHLLGLNLVRTAKRYNRITVSDSYIRKTSKEFCELLSEKDGSCTISV